MTSTELLFVVSINALAFWQKKHIFFFFLIVPVDITYGLQWAIQGEPGSTYWLEGIALAIIGTWALFHIASEVWGSIRTARMKRAADKAHSRSSTDIRAPVSKKPRS